MPMPSQSHLLRSSLALAGLLALAPATGFAQAQPKAKDPHAGHSHARKPVIPPDAGPVEELYKQRQYEAAVRKADELRGAKQVTSGNEYWAARALRVMKRYDESADRFREVSEKFPGTEDAAKADVDTWVAILGKMPEGYHDAAARKLATDTAGELLGVAKKHAGKDGAAQARALYIAGNAFRMGHADEKAATAYASCRALTGNAEALETGYPDKCTQGLASIKARNWEEEEALALYRECAVQDRNPSTAKRCSKNLARMELVGHQAPELKMETWVNGAPQTLAQNRGNVVMLFFFATWCPHCKTTLPTLPR
jgi:thiol-disulfide isomerase/thioredoxin